MRGSRRCKVAETNATEELFAVVVCFISEVKTGKGIGRKHEGKVARASTAYLSTLADFEKRNNT